jgi:hypothetical protein
LVGLLVFDIPNWNIKAPNARGRLYFADSRNLRTPTLVDRSRRDKQLKTHHLLITCRSISLGISGPFGYTICGIWFPLIGPP